MSEKTIKHYIKNGILDLDKMVDDYTSYIKTIITNMVGYNLSNEDKEEILIDVFFTLWKSYSNNKNILLLDSYIAGITKNLVKNKLRKLNYTVDISDYENIIEIYQNDIDTYENEIIWQLRNCIKSLKNIDIKIVNSYYYDAKSIKDIAKELNITEINVKTRLYRIRKRIKKTLIKGGFKNE